ncbi:MAG: hypothetical protein Q8P18_21475 [Pseudomonadota bacterium]|nr:hypothetical protein [Pseudomonadota bacterium]
MTKVVVIRAAAWLLVGASLDRLVTTWTHRNVVRDSVARADAVLESAYALEREVAELEFPVEPSQRQEGAAGGKPPPELGSPSGSLKQAPRTPGVECSPAVGGRGMEDPNVATLNAHGSIVIQPYKGAGPAVGGAIDTQPWCLAAGEFFVRLHDEGGQCEATLLTEPRTDNYLYCVGDELVVESTRMETPVRE